MNRLRQVAAIWAFTAANVSDSIGAATRESFAALGFALRPKPKPRRKPLPGWVDELRQVRR